MVKKRLFLGVFSAVDDLSLVGGIHCINNFIVAENMGFKISLQIADPEKAEGKAAEHPDQASGSIIGNRPVLGKKSTNECAGKK